MKSIILIASLLASTEQVIVFVDGTRMEIQAYEVRGPLVTLTTLEGKLQSLPLSYVDVDATERANQASPSMPTESIEPEPAVVAPPPEPEPAPEPEPTPMPPAPAQTTPAPSPVSPAAPPPPPAPSPRTAAAAPPPVWSNEELRVSLVVPSTDWRLPEMPPSFDVAVALANPAREGRATLALIRQELRSRRDFERVLSDIRASVSRSPGFRSVHDGVLDLEPYTAHEFRFLKTVDGEDVFNRLTVVYSRDLAYVLSLTCPIDRSASLEADFNAFVRGLVVKKGRRELTY